MRILARHRVCVSLTANPPRLIVPLLSLAPVCVARRRGATFDFADERDLAGAPLALAVDERRGLAPLGRRERLPMSHLRDLRRPRTLQTHSALAACDGLGLSIVSSLHPVLFRDLEEMRNLFGRQPEHRQ